MIPPTLAAARADALLKRARLQASLAEAKYRLFRKAPPPPPAPIAPPPPVPNKE